MMAWYHIQLYGHALPTSSLFLSKFRTNLLEDQKWKYPDSVFNIYDTGIVPVCSSACTSQDWGFGGINPVESFIWEHPSTRCSNGRLKVPITCWMFMPIRAVISQSKIAGSWSFTWSTCFHDQNLGIFME